MSLSKIAMAAMVTASITSPIYATGPHQLVRGVGGDIRTLNSLVSQSQRNARRKRKHRR